MSDLTIRRGRPSEYALAATIERDSNTSIYAARASREPTSNDLHVWELATVSPRSELYFGSIDEVEVAMAHFLISNRGTHSPKARLQNLAVLRQLQSQEIGSHFYSILEAQLRERGIGLVGLTAGNARVHRFYERLGFVQTSQDGDMEHDLSLDGVGLGF